MITILQYWTRIDIQHLQTSFIDASFKIPVLFFPYSLVQFEPCKMFEKETELLLTLNTSKAKFCYGLQKYFACINSQNLLFCRENFTWVLKDHMNCGREPLVQIVIKFKEKKDVLGSCFGSLLPLTFWNFNIFHYFFFRCICLDHQRCVMYTLRLSFHLVSIS